MAKSASISARIDPDLKSQAEEIFSELELTASQAIAMFYRQVINKQGIPFEVTARREENGSNGHVVGNGTDLPAVAHEKMVVEPGSESPIYQGPEHEAILKEREAYEAMHTELWGLYPHQYVAIYQGEVVDHDDDEIALFERRRTNYVGKSVLITQVEETPERKTIRVRSPRLIR